MTTESSGEHLPVLDGTRQGRVIGVIERIVSGGQNGVDQAGLRAARAVGIATGGWAPHGWTTLDGPAPWLADYGLAEHARPGYPSRTEANVRDSDATIRIAVDFLSAGERLTISMVDRHKKPRADVFLIADRIHGGHRVTGFVVDGARRTDPRAYEALVGWMRRYRVINVAGNSERTAPGIGASAEGFLRSLFTEVQR